MMRRLDWYIFKEILFPFIFGLAAFTVISAGGGVLYNIISKSLKYGIPATTAGQLFLYSLPRIVSVVFPMATLVGTIVAFGRLKSDCEILALRSVGISFLRISRPVIIFGILISLVNIAFNEWIVPKANYNYELLLETAKSTGVKIQNNVNLTEYDQEGEPKRIINVRQVNDLNLQDITVAEYDDGQLSRLVRAKTGKWHPKGVWEFNNGVMHSFFADQDERILMMRFEKELIDIHLDPIDPMQTKKSVSEMNARDLKQWISYKRDTGQDYTKALVEYYLKFSLPFACVVFSLVGITVSMGPHRGSSSIGFALSIMIIIIYYILYTIGMTLGLMKVLPPLLAAWFPNVVVGIMDVVLFRKLAFR